ncbi:MAG: transglycosylase family protein [Solirubrobacterales bacterium]|nr:transglycosylase family protein [Solirubrobacterales bacterium]
MNAPTRRFRRGLVLAACGLALGAPAAIAAETGGLAAGDAPATSASSSGSSSAKPRSAPAERTRITRKTIKAVQRKLRRKPDGIYGKRTRAAVRRFQKRRKLQVDGKLGPQTLAALKIKAEPRRAPTPPANADQLLELIADCESGGDPTAVSSSGKYRGKYQFLRSTWSALGGDGDPAKAPEGEQDERAGELLAEEGTKPWPTCGRKAVAQINGDG